MSIVATALKYDLDIECKPYRIEVHCYDTSKSETFTFGEDVNLRKDRRAALVRCVTRAAAKARELRGESCPGEQSTALK